MGYFMEKFLENGWFGGPYSRKLSFFGKSMVEWENPGLAFIYFIRDQDLTIGTSP